MKEMEEGAYERCVGQLGSSEHSAEVEDQN